MRQVKIVIDYKTHTNEEDRFLTCYYCPFCGKKKVWDEHDMGDYYCGTTMVCINCKKEFSFQEWKNDNNRGDLIIKQLQEKK